MIAEVIGPGVAEMSVKALWRRLSSLAKHGKGDGIRSVLSAAVDLAALRAVTEDDSNWSEAEVRNWVDRYESTFQGPVADALEKDSAYVRLLSASDPSVGRLSLVEKPELVWPLLTDLLDGVSIAAKELNIWIDEFEFQLPAAVAWAIHQEAIQRKANKVDALHDWLTRVDSLSALQRIAAPTALSPRVRRQGWLRISELTEAYLNLYFRSQIGFGMAQALFPNPSDPTAAHQEPDVWVEVETAKRFPRRAGAPLSTDENDWSNVVHEEASEQVHHAAVKKSWRSVVACGRNTVLLGNPGHGKTWLLTLLASDRTRAFRAKLRAFEPIEGIPFPVFSRVDQLVTTAADGSSLGRLEEVVVATLQARCGLVTDPDGFSDAQLWKDLERHIDDYGLELFLDALDEAPEGLRGWIRDWQVDHPAPERDPFDQNGTASQSPTRSLVTAAAQQASGRIIISSRLAGYRQPDGVDDSWETVTLSPLKKESCLDLATAWGVPKAAMDAMRQDLDGATTMGHVLRVPLLLNIACILAVDGRPWPRSVRDLYSGYIDYRVAAALHYWSQAQPRPTTLPYDVGQVESILGELALRFSGQGSSRWRDQMGSQEVRDLLRQHLEAGETTQTALDRLLQCGLIVGASPSSAGQVYYFQHRTIAEYLVAKRVVDSGQWPLFLTVDFWFHRDWDRTLQLIGELVAPHEYAQVIHEQGTDLLGRGTQLATHSFIAWDEVPGTGSQWVEGRWLALMRRADEYNALTRLSELGRMRSDWFYSVVGKVLGPQVIAFVASRDDPRVVPYLIGIERDEPRLRKQVLAAMGTAIERGRLNQDQRRQGENWLRARLADVNYSAKAALSLSVLTEPSAETVQALSEFLTTSEARDPEIRAAVWKCLERHASSALTPSALLGWLDDADVGKRLAALQLLADAPHDDTAVTVLTQTAKGAAESVLSTSDAEQQARLLKQAAIETLGRQGEVPAVWEVFEESTDGVIAATAARVLAADRSAGTEKRLLARLEFFLAYDTGDSWQAAEEIITSLAGRDDPRVIGCLRGLIGEPKEERTHDLSAYAVTSAAITALVRTKPDDSVRTLMLAILENQDEGPVARAAAHGLIAMTTQATLVEDVSAWVVACRKNNHLSRNAFYDAAVCEDFAWATSILPPNARKTALERLDSVWTVFDSDGENEPAE
jgi:hypothetical protein